MRAKTSLPVPVSPMRRTVASLLAMRVQARTRSMIGDCEAQTIPSGFGAELDERGEGGLSAVICIDTPCAVGGYSGCASSRNRTYSKRARAMPHRPHGQVAAESRRPCAEMDHRPSVTAALSQTGKLN